MAPAWVPGCARGPASGAPLRYRWRPQTPLSLAAEASANRRRNDAMGYETLTFEVRDGVGYLTLNRPKAANALNLEMAQELVEVGKRCDENAKIRAVLLTGAGRMFCAGGDLRRFAEADEGIPAFVQKLASTFHESLSILGRMEAPIVVAVNGAAAGAGMSLVCHADLAIAAESAKFTMAYTAAGLTPDGSATYFLPRMIGRRRAAELMLTNRRLSAAEALEWNFVNRVVPDGELMAEAEKLARTLASGPTRAYGGIKKLLIASATNDFETQMDLEMKFIVDTAGSRDGAEGINAFLEKRAPKFTGD
jgi:2-(1,2-epoxy-1,2-dihydrophenyl)acetyl-CoA isomerase